MSESGSRPSEDGLRSLKNLPFRQRYRLYRGGAVAIERYELLRDARFWQVTAETARAAADDAVAAITGVVGQRDRHIAELENALWEIAYGDGDASTAAEALWVLSRERRSSRDLQDQPTASPVPEEQP